MVVVTKTHLACHLQDDKPGGTGTKIEVDTLSKSESGKGKNVTGWVCSTTVHTSRDCFHNKGKSKDKGTSNKAS